jgi:1-acyl-sn-glycerol-3-phosphate acyltransferase
VGQRILYPTYTKDMRTVLFKSSKIRAIIKKTSEQQALLLRMEQERTLNETQDSLLKQQEHVERLEKEVTAVASTIVDKLIARLDSITLLRSFAFIVGNVLVRLYHQGIHVLEHEFMEVRRWALMAQEKNMSLLIVPCHKSHLDYLLISYLMLRLGLAIPHIIAGNNLDLPVLGYVLQKCGAFFIKRSWGNDHLYTTIVHEYVQTLLQMGHNVECFIEGTRSRTGKLLSPKFGFLKIVVDALMSGKVKDVVVVPISVGYDRVIETETYVDELLGRPKQKESLYQLFSSTSILQPKWGRVDIRFAKPFLLRDYLDTQVEKRKLTIAPDVAITHTECGKVLLRALGYRILGDINGASVTMPTALIGTVILTARGRGVGRNELIRRINWLRREIHFKGGRVAHFDNTSIDDVINRCIHVLGGLIGERKGLLEPVYHAIKQYELSYYRNQVIHLFISEAIISVALYTKVKQGGAALTQRISKAGLMERIVFLSKLLKGEFIFGSDGIDINTQKTLVDLVESRVLTRLDDDTITLSDHERSIGRENYDFYCFLLWPFVETYWLMSISLFALASLYAQPSATHVVSDDLDPQVGWTQEGEFIKAVVLLGKTLYYQGDISYLESVNKETLKNALDRLVQMKLVLHVSPATEKERSMVALNPPYLPDRSADGSLLPSGELWSIVDRIGQFRREGKNRRDNATVSTRVLKLVDMMGKKQLYTKSKL